jgi:hypothetical protein
MFGSAIYMSGCVIDASRCHVNVSRPAIGMY